MHHSFMHKSYTIKLYNACALHSCFRNRSMFAIFVDRLSACFYNGFVIIKSRRTKSGFKRPKKHFFGRFLFAKKGSLTKQRCMGHVKCQERSNHEQGNYDGTFNKGS